ncbi:hypothetical protein BJV74DRAFT_277790 [Russula compacta]|nr:hypothetical protein BJV74DRAFT_277790 [Russula compacta]
MVYPSGLVTTLDYEWRVIQGRHPYRWTIWIYSLTRVATLAAVIVNMISFDVASSINCQAWVTSELIFVYIAFAAASLLIVLRVIAIWNRKKIISAIAISVWCTNVGFLIRGTVRILVAWMPVQDTCAVLNIEDSKRGCYRSLINSSSVNSSNISPKRSSHIPSDDAKGMFAVPLNRMEVAVHADYERYPVSQASQDDSYISTQDGQLVHDKPIVLGLGEDIESGIEK